MARYVDPASAGLINELSKLILSKYHNFVQSSFYY